MNETTTAKPGLLLSGDLFFTSKITSTANSLGAKVWVVSQPAVWRSTLESKEPSCVFIDLESLVLPLEQIAESFGDEHQPRLIAFGSHVNKEQLQAARDIGCDEVMPRSKFSAELPKIIQRTLLAE